MMLEPHNDGGEYFTVDRLTLADISVSYALKLAEIVGYLDRTHPATKDCWERIQEHPTFIKAMAVKHDLVLEAQRSSSKD